MYPRKSGADGIRTHYVVGSVIFLPQEAFARIPSSNEVSIGYGNLYATAFAQEFASWTPRPSTSRIFRSDGQIHNNKMERMNGEVRDRERVMWGLKRMDTPILKGYQIFLNYIRPHEGLNGQTPAERAGIKVRGADKWTTLIQRASKKDQALERYGYESPILEHKWVHQN